MCGIVGILTREVQGRERLTRDVVAMADTLTHRGPDDAGKWIDEDQGVALGHRRLAILDLSPAGHQPMCNETGRVWLVFNGEIYNFPSLRAELEAEGHIFRSKTDSEVVVHAYEQYGDDFVRRLDGMFALALWDQDRERLILARDRAGKKPLYYYAGCASHLVFGSEIKALLANSLVPGSLNAEAIPLYLTYGYVPCPETFYRDVLQIPPASYLVVEQGKVLGPFRYWELTFPLVGEERRVSETEACLEIRRLLTSAIERRLLSDVPLGAFLSGGIDSSIVVGLMSRLMGRRVKTFSIGFAGDKSFDETPYSRIVARHFRTDHTEFIVEPHAFDLVDRLLWHHDQPYGDSSAIPTYILSKLARQHVTVALNGDGGDEVFAGYERFLGVLVSERLPKPLVGGGRAVIEALPGFCQRSRKVAKIRRFLLQAAKPLKDRYLPWCSFFSQEALVELLVHPALAGVQRSFEASWSRTEGCALLNRVLHVNFMNYLPDDLLVKMDRMSMANALETRSPLLDTALIEYVASLPVEFKIKRGRLKYIFKKAFQDLLPKEILTRGKQGFGVPLGTWFRGELKPLLEDLLLGEAPRYRPFVQQEAVRRIYREHQEGRRDHGGQLWTLMNLEVWLRKI